MACGDTKEICNAACPILQGQYVEVSEGPPVGEHSRPFEPPRYLRVVPTISCNLRCPMCYQADAPPTRLPPNLFELLKPWITTAQELQVLGGETFLTRQCLDWIKQISPGDFPNCKLAAITNGLGFSPEVCELIQQREWSWILVSVDAASADTYARVRGGNFQELLENLDRLATARARSTSQFEIRFGFTLQLSNLDDAVAFLDLCATYRAMPQYTLVFGDWHSEAPSTPEDVQRFYATLEKLDKRLWQRGFGNHMLASSMAALTERAKKISQPRRAGNGGRKTPLIGTVAGEGLRAGVTWEFKLSEALTQSRLGTLEKRMRSSRANGPAKRLVITIDKAIAEETLRDALASLPVEEYSIRVPFFAGSEAISALWVYSSVDSIQRLGQELGWNLMAQPLELQELGLEKSNCRLECDTVFESGERRNCSLSVVTPVYNCERFIQRFAQSLFSQKTDQEIEVVVVDDGSTDQSLETLLRATAHLGTRAHLLILRRKREIPYQPKTFTFSAGLAREIGCQYSLGARVLFLDPDQIVEPGCIQEHLDLGGRGIDVVIGDRRMESPDVLTSWSCLRSSALSAQTNWWLSFFTGNASVARSLLADAGGFDCTFQYWGLDDTDLAYRLYRLGSSVWQTPRAVVTDLSPNGSGGGRTTDERADSYRLHMEVLYRKYLDAEILHAFSFVWPQCLR
jgi:glycosyltransferase involved in cell wall biosynthesis/molybdenum cofactor biosynthesis enzyme MoaA